MKIKLQHNKLRLLKEHKLLLLVWEAKITLKSLTVVQRDYASHFIKMTKSIKYYSKVLVPKVIQQGTGVQVIYGPHVTVIKNEIEELLGD